MEIPEKIQFWLWMLVAAFTMWLGMLIAYPLEVGIFSGMATITLLVVYSFD